MKKEYDTEASKLAEVIDIAIASFNKYPPKEFSENNIKHAVNTYLEWKESVLNPLPRFKTFSSLKYIIADVFAFFQGSDGEAIEYFWKRINEQNLGFLRENKLQKIIQRGRIKGRVEYELALDSIVAAKQEGRITEEESQRLSSMIGHFEELKKRLL